MRPPRFPIPTTLTKPDETRRNRLNRKGAKNAKEAKRYGDPTVVWVVARSASRRCWSPLGRAAPAAGLALPQKLPPVSVPASACDCSPFPGSGADSSRIWTITCRFVGAIRESPIGIKISEFRHPSREIGRGKGTTAPVISAVLRCTDWVDEQSTTGWRAKRTGEY